MAQENPFQKIYEYHSRISKIDRSIASDFIEFMKSELAPDDAEIVEEEMQQIEMILAMFLHWMKN